MSTQNSLRRAAVLISSLPPEAAARVLATMSPDQRQRVRAEARRLGSIDDAERKKIIAAFMRSTETPAPAAKNAPNSGSPTSQAVTETTGDTTNANGNTEHKAPSGFEFLHEVDDDILQQALKDQPSQAIAVVLAHLPPVQAARLLGKLTPDARDQVILRLSRIDEVTPDALADVGEHLRSLLQESLRKSNAVGRRALAAMASHMEGDMLKAVTRAIPDMKFTPVTVSTKENAPSLVPASVVASAYESEVPNRSSGGPAESVGTRHATDSHAAVLPFPGSKNSNGTYTGSNNNQGPALTFADLQRLPPTTLRRLLAEVESETAVLALLGMRVDVAEAVLATLPRRQAKQVRREIASLGPLLLRDIDRAQGEVEQAALKLQQIGALPLPQRLSAAA